MKQFGVVIPGLLAGFKNDSRFNGWSWHHDNIAGQRLVTEDGKPFPVRIQSMYCEAPAMAMFSLSLVDSVLGVHAEVEECRHTLIGMVSIENRQQFIEALGQFLEVVQHCHIYDSEAEQEHELGRLTASLLDHTPIKSNNTLAKVLGHLGVLASDSCLVGWEGKSEMDEWQRNAIRWRLMGGKLKQQLVGTNDKAFCAMFHEIMEVCRFLSVSNDFGWCRITNSYQLTIAGNDDVPRAVFSEGTLTDVMNEAMTFLNIHVEKKYAEEA